MTSACSCRARQRATAATVGVGVLESDERLERRGVVGATGHERLGQRLERLVPGVASTAFQDGGKVGSRPARRNELLPAPDGPITPSSRGRFSFFQTASTSTSRPKKYSASCSVNAARPGYGLPLLQAPGSRSVTSSRARASAWADGYRSVAARRERPLEHGRPGTLGYLRRRLPHARARAPRASRARRALRPKSSRPAPRQPRTRPRARRPPRRAPVPGAMYAGVPAIVLAACARVRPAPRRSP